MRHVILQLIFSLILVGCASSSDSDGYMLPELDEGSQAHPYTYNSDGMTFRKIMPDRREWKPWEFYYKHCSVNGNETYYSKTSYDCSGPYY